MMEESSSSFCKQRNEGSEMLVNYLKVLKESGRGYMKITFELLSDVLLPSYCVVYTNLSTYYMWPVGRKDKEKPSRQLLELLKFKLFIMSLALHNILEFHGKNSSEIRDASTCSSGENHRMSSRVTLFFQASYLRRRT